MSLTAIKIITAVVLLFIGSHLLIYSIARRTIAAAKADAEANTAGDVQASVDERSPSP